MASDNELGDITKLLALARDGDARGRDKLLHLVYGQLRAIAGNRMRHLPAGQTLQPTALIHETYMRALGEGTDFENRRHFFMVAAMAMRNILVDRARSKTAQKRGGDFERSDQDPLELPIEAPAQDMFALHEALQKLESLHPRPYQLVMLRYFAGLTGQEAAEILEVGESTADRDWRFAKAFLFRQLSES